MQSISVRQTLFASCLTGAALLLTPAALTQTPNDPVLAELAETARQDAGAPAAAMMRMYQGEVRIGVAGLRDIDDSVEVTPDDLWHIGSNTKSMTATLIARLAEQGVISWDDTVEQHLGEAIDTIDPGFADVTFRHLLSHYSGAKANIGMFHMMRFLIEGSDGRPMPEQRLDYAGHILAQSPQSEPGTSFLYSNAGYVIAGAMLEQATGETWETLIAREVFEPLGIDDFGFGAPGSTDIVDQPRGHRGGLFGGLTSQTGAEGDNPPVLGPAGTLHISLPDYALYLQAHIDGGRGVESDFLTAESWDILLTQPFDTPYAMGWGLGSDELQHSGSNTLWVMHTAVVPEQDFGAIVVMNRAIDRSGGQLLRAISEAD